MRLKNPSVLLSLISHTVTLLILLGFNINESFVLSISTALLSILTILGIMSNPDTKTKGYGDDTLVCSNCGGKSIHVEINGQMLCKNCGTVYTTTK